MGLVPAREAFLELARERADANGALLVLDEVISGFRVARGGAHELTGVIGDLTIMGKVIGGGLPAAAVGGRAEVMSCSRPPATSTRRARCLATRWRWPPAWRRWSCSTRTPIAPGRDNAALAEGLREAAREARALAGRAGTVQVASAPGLLTVFFSERQCRVRRRAGL